MEQPNIQQLDQWHWEGKHQEVVDAIYAMPPEQWDYTVICLLARALNGLKRYEEALHFLLSVHGVGDEDPLWHFQTGYAYFYLEEYPTAQAEFDTALALNPDERISNEFFLWCRDELQRRDPMYCPKVYTPEELEAVETHIMQCFGDYPTVFHELVSTDIHVDICIIPPTPARNYYILVTLGMGAHRMNVPEDLRDRRLDRAEVLVCLPPDWNIQGNDEKDYWPLRWLKTLAHLPIDENSWLGWGHTVPCEAPFAENTDLSGVLLINPFAFGPAAESCILPNGDEVNFYQMIPLYANELQYKLQHGTEALLELMPHKMLEVVNIHRRNVCSPTEIKCLQLPPEDIQPVLTDWKGPDHCIADDRIMVDGQPIAYMYREAPNPSFYDSGWRFSASADKEACTIGMENSAVYPLNTLCNYAPDILPLLESPVGTAYMRDSDGVFQLEEFVRSDNF